MNRCPMRQSGSLTDANASSDPSCSSVASVSSLRSSELSGAIQIMDPSPIGRLSRDTAEHPDGWDFLDQLEVQEISGYIVSSVRQIKPFLRDSFAYCCATPLKLLVEDPRNGSCSY